MRVALIRTGTQRHRLILTNHHIVMDGWSLPILLHEIFTAYHGQRLPAAVPYRTFVSWLATRDLDAARAAWAEVLAGFDTPTLLGPALHRQGRRDVRSLQLSAATTGAVGELARAHRTTVNVVLQSAYAQLLMHLTGRRDIVFGTPVSGRPTDVPGADAMVGLMINTVPVRATVAATTSAADLLDQMQRTHNATLEHEYLALAEIHRITAQDKLFDTMFAYENYPLGAAAAGFGDALAITDFEAHEENHYPLTVQVSPGAELSLRVEYDTEVFTRDRDRDVHRTIRAVAGRDDRRPHAGTGRPRSARRGRARPARPVRAPAHAGRAGGRDVDPGAVHRAGRPHPRTRWPSDGGASEATGNGRRVGRRPIVNSTNPRTGWHICWSNTAPAQDNSSR